MTKAFRKATQDLQEAFQNLRILVGAAAAGMGVAEYKERMRVLGVFTSGGRLNTAGFAVKPA